MCEASVYMVRQGQEELLMEKVDRIIPGEDGSIFMESIFGERKVVQGRIRELELVHHRVVLEEIAVGSAGAQNGNMAGARHGTRSFSCRRRSADPTAIGIQYESREMPAICSGVQAWVQNERVAGPRSAP